MSSEIIRVLSGEDWTIRIGDVLVNLRAMPDNSVHVVIVSPPYWMLRDYGFIGQIGLEETPELYVAKMVEVFAEVRRVLRPDGLLFLNLGDSYADDSKWGGKTSGKHVAELHGKTATGRRKRVTGLPAGSAVGIPWRVALALQADGWILRGDLIWHKPTAMPESVSGHRWMKCRKKIAKAKFTNERNQPGKEDGGQRDCASFSSEENKTQWEPCPGCPKCAPNDGYVLRKGRWRPSRGHEMLFMFSKTNSYYSDGDGSKEPCSGGAHSRGKGMNPKSKATNVDGGDRSLKSKANNSFAANCSDLVETRNLRSVWSIVPNGYKGGHFATFPLELVRRCLSAATSRGGCCGECGQQYAPVVRSERKATRPGKDSKVNRASAQQNSPYSDQRGTVVGNRDPQRHTTISIVDDYRPVCSCRADKAKPVVMDCFAGVSTTGRVAINMGCKYIGLEGSAEYATLGAAEIVKPYDAKPPKKDTKKRRVKLIKQLMKQLHLDYELEPSG